VIGIPVLIIGKSGSGKSSSLRNFETDGICLIDAANKPLPFKKRFAETYKTDDYDAIYGIMSATEKNVIVIDDAGYLIVNHFMRSHAAGGIGNAIFAFFNKLADEFWQLIEFTKQIENKIVYIIMHEQSDDFGNCKPKTIGKLLDDKVCIEGMFTISLRSIRDKSGYWFVTNSEGFCPSKSPFGMFESQLIKNDLKTVTETVRDFYTGE
jgi:hypothetical protein